MLDDGMLDMFYFDGLWRWTGIVVYVTGGIIGVKTLIINGRSFLCATTRLGAPASSARQVRGGSK